MKISTKQSEIEALLTRRVDQVVVEESLRERLASGEKLRVKLGVDPTAPDIHLGHSVALKKMREFQDMGHQAILIIGDYTSLVGDPSGKSKTRPMLSSEEIEVNAQTYLDQAGKVLDLDKLEIRHNSEWFSKMTFKDILDLVGKFTVARIIEREDFRNRLDEGSDIGMHELLYPVMQAYDSVQLNADIELGGTDQRFNILAGRDLQKKLGQKPQDAMFLGPILVGTDGVKKMSKSLNNYIGLTESPEDMYGKTMSIPDAIMWDWFLMATDVPQLEIQEIRTACDDGEMNPREAKARLAMEIVTAYHSDADAAKAEEHFNRTVRNKEIPDEIEEFAVSAGKHGLIDLLSDSKLASTKSEARRLIEQGGIKVDGEAIKEIKAEIDVKEPVLIQKGKRGFIRIVVKK